MWRGAKWSVRTDVPEEAVRIARAPEAEGAGDREPSRAADDPLDPAPERGDPDQQGQADPRDGRSRFRRSSKASDGGRISDPSAGRAFGWDLDRWIFFGGYPGAAPLARNQESWRRYVADSLVETAIARDVLAMQRVAKPALLRNLFGLATQRPAQIVSYTKMLGGLQDAGNTVTLARYLKLLESASLVSGLEATTGRIRQRGSIPKLVSWNNALVTAMSGLSFAEARRDTALWGHLVENAYGAHLLNHLPAPRFTVEYWRHRGLEVDFVVRRGRARVAIEVKSGRPDRRMGLDAFKRRFPSARVLLVGRGGLPLEEAFERLPEEYLRFR